MNPCIKRTEIWPKGLAKNIILINLRAIYSSNNPIPESILVKVKSYADILSALRQTRFYINRLGFRVEELGWGGDVGVWCGDVGCVRVL